MWILYENIEVKNKWISLYGYYMKILKWNNKWISLYGSYMKILKWNNKRISLYGSYMKILNEIINEYLLWLLYDNYKMK